MEGSEELETSLLTQPWASVCFGKSTFLAKACFRDTGYILLISDLSSVWYESADAEAVGQRSKELNKRLTVHVSSFLHRLRNLMCPLLAGQPDAATSFSCHHTAGGLSLHVKSELSGLPFYWDFHCCPAPVEMTLPQICGAEEGQAFASALQQLYTAVMQQETKQARKRQHSEDTEGPVPAAEITGHPHPPPPSQEDETASSSEGTTPASSPAQKPRLPAAKAKPKKAKGLFS